MNCKPKMFYGNEGAEGLTRWIKKTKFVFEINSCAEGSKVKFIYCTFVDATMSQWNSHVKTMGLANDNSLTWEKLMQMLIEEYCPWEEM